MHKVRFDQLDPIILWIGVCLLLTGLVMVTSASLHVASINRGNAFYFSEREVAYILIGLFSAAIVYRFVPTALLKSLRWVAVFVAFATLLVVLVPGLSVEVNGSKRWINLGVVTVQASEVAKLCLVVYLAGYIDSHKASLRESWKAFLGPMFILAIMAGLLLLEPNFGAIVVLAICALGMLLMAGVPLRYFVILFLVALVLGGVLAFAQPYRVARLMSFLDPWHHQFDSGYQLTQSLIAFGRGHWGGVGLGHGIQKLFYLPEAHTDFVFSVLGEELGLVGVFFVISIFSGLGYAIFKLGWALQQQDNIHAAMLVYGVGMIICTQAFTNMGVTMGVLPTKGLTLPFVSYGGSSLVISLCMLSLVLRAAAEQSSGTKSGRAG